jgi:thiamine biosynthesis protein ThiS
MTTLWINGERREVAGSVGTVAELLEVIGLPAGGTLVEQNGLALFPRDFAVIPVVENDRFEFVRIAAGG